MSATFDVIPVIEQGDHGEHDRHEIQLALTPNAQRQLIRAIARACLIAKHDGTPLYVPLLAAGHPQIDEIQSHALDQVQAVIGTSWASFTVSPDEATALGNALLDAGETPTTCTACGHLIDTDCAGTECVRCSETPKGLRSA
ncbi:hypothetical protein [Knoellia sp. LjRoot47]|uniref:hypothetical protein n=1 Tax=Knoellia sp. LjRoot47 TaxID=3342330 RepID=UPI003ECEDF4D